MQHSFSLVEPQILPVIPAMDHIDNILATKSNSSQFSLPIQVTLVVGKNTINWYYNKTDHLEVYRIAMGKYYHAFCLLSSLIMLLNSSSPMTQAQLLQDSRLGRSLD